MEGSDVVTELYRRLLLRDPDPVGLAAFSDLWNSGHGARVVEGLLASDEYGAVMAQANALRSSRRVGIAHIPKCAGTSLKKSLQDVVPLYAGPIYFHRRAIDGPLSADWGGQGGSIGSLGALVARHPIIMGHYPAGVLLEAGATDLIVTAREPRARLVSLYRFWQSQPASLFSGDPLLARVLGQGLGAFLSQPNRGAVYGVIAAHTLTDRASWAPNQSVTRLWRSMRAYIRRAAWPAEIPSVVAHVSGLLGVPNTMDPVQRRDNVTVRADRDPEVITDEVMTLIDRLTRPDKEILELLMEEGLLTHRTQSDLDQDFADVAVSHGFVLA